MNEQELKIESLLQRMAEQTRTYENAIADLRVRIHKLTESNQILREAASAVSEEESADHADDVSE